MPVPLSIAAPREGVAAGVWTLLVVGAVDLLRAPCTLPAGGSVLGLLPALLAQGWPLCWQYATPGPYVFFARVLSLAIVWLIGRIIVWKLQARYPRYFLCPTRPVKRQRPPVCTLADAVVVPHGGDELLPEDHGVADDPQGKLEATKQVAMRFPLGQLIVRDYRSAVTRRDAASNQWRKERPLRVVTWNIERGIEMEAILAELKALDADVVLLQEVDVGCERSGYIDTGACIAKGLGMQLLYASEFVEFPSSSRDKHSAGGGVHGNAIATWLDIEDAWAFHHQWEIYSWRERGPLLDEPRVGARIAVGAELRVPAGALQLEPTAGAGIMKSASLRCYSIHLENFCGAAGRYLQFSEILHHVAQRRGTTGDMPLVLGGDLNTLVTGVTRLLPLLFDPMTVYTTVRACMSEAALWKEWLAHGGPGVDHKHVHGVPTAIKVALLLMGVNPSGAARVEQPMDPSLTDPFHPDRDTTVEELGGKWTAKLDWLLMNKLTCITHSMGGEHASDHQWLASDVRMNCHD